LCFDQKEKSARLAKGRASGDDASVIFPRQGLVACPPIKVRNIDGTQGAGRVARKWEDWQADACFIDDTGGFGSSWIDNLRRLGREPIGLGATRGSFGQRALHFR
jgi:hypothetical protein